MNRITLPYVSPVGMYRNGSFITVAPFGSPTAIRLAQLGNAAYARARELGYTRMQSMRYADLAKLEGADWESPDQVAARVVPPLHGPHGPSGGGVAA